VRLLHEAHGGVRSSATEQAILFAFERVVVDEEVLEFLDPLAGEIFQLTNIGVHVVGVGDGDESVIANFLFTIQLFAFADTAKAGANGDSGEGGLIHEQEHVDGITVGRKGLRKEAEVVGEDHAGGKHFFEGEDALMGIEGKFGAAAGGGFDDDLKEAVFLVDGLEAGWIGESFHVRPDVE
jgi:hypothetical protein